MSGLREPGYGDSKDRLERECVVWTRYLVGAEPTQGVVHHYIAGHASIPFLRDPQALARFDRTLLRAAARSPFLARVSDAYARLFRPYGPLRQKLLLLLAILENSPPFHRRLNGASGAGPTRGIVGLVVAGVGFAGALALGLVLFGPPHMIWNRGAGPTADG